MRASVGDTIRVHGRTVGSGEQEGQIIEVRGEHGEPPYLVRFADGHEGLMFPGPDCEVEAHAE
ncbi:DUF1918 domain-containing protein [Saccharomonospora piscinae]|uniref:DUF1918 domain-containing protein n=1 Tax=Saccharomonospora piscinae TaxID=687388 RepID=A0A1V9A2I5_SACPI|nr:DUF1918 domain-containing protein [Saccharomonospora piscinae]OQO91273.1 DUF1918 domain-containing protein [Saccharomonospora piscinae]TLW93860.1 DUF1918 domain-containing protein [Saccharomonospora piscinae]